MTTTTPVRTPEPPVRRRWAVPPWALVAMVTAVVLALVGSGIALWRSDSGGSVTPVPVGTATVTPSTPPSATASTPDSTPSGGTTPGSGTATGTATAPSSAFRFVPLWPFGSVAEAAAWQRDTGAQGHQAWRLDAGRAAVAFAGGYLGYTEIDRVTSTRVVGDQAWVGVGFTPPAGAEAAHHTVAVLHLARIGTGALDTRPWEVVGSRDTDLSLTTPRYGATVGSTFTVGGRITGVDESLVVQVRSLDEQLLQQGSGLPAGGVNTPWSSTVTLDHPHSGVAVVAVSTGGHLMGVERFAITAVRVRLP